jgi:hypothetical protein
MSFARDGKSRAETRRQNFKTQDPDTGEVTIQQALTAPPRKIGFFSRIYILISGLSMTFGLGFGAIGFFLFILGMRVSMKEKARAESGGTFITTVGTVTQLTIEKGSRDKKDTYIYESTYMVDGKVLKNVSRFTKEDAFRINKAENDTLSIEYFSTEPLFSNIVGYRGGDFSNILLSIGFLFSTVATVFLIVGWRSRRKTLKLFLRGLTAWGEKVSREKTGTQIDKLYVYKYVYAFVAADNQRYEVIAKATEALNIGDEQELVLYLAEKPSHNIIYDAVDTAPIVKEDGSLQVKHKIGPWFCLCLFIFLITLGISIPMPNL